MWGCENNCATDVIQSWVRFWKMKTQAQRRRRALSGDPVHAPQSFFLTQDSVSSPQDKFALMSQLLRSCIEKHSVATCKVYVQKRINNYETMQVTKTSCCNSFMWVWTKTLDSCFPQRLWPSLKFNALWKWLQLVAALQREGRREGGFIMHPNLLTLSFFLLRANSSPLSCTFSPLLLLLPSLPSISPLSCRQCELTNCQSWKILSTS